MKKILNKMKNPLLAVVSFFITACNAAVDFKGTGTNPVSHEQWNKLLKKHVTADGKVNYKGFQKDSVELNQYLLLLSDNPPDENTWTKQEQLAYWINGYNAFTVKLVLRHYPLSSIKDIGAKIKIPFVNTPWDIKFIKIGKETLDLNNIEHGILRKKFNEPRIHFAIVCASFSCPKLRNEAFFAEKIEEQLKEQATNFINDKAKNTITQNAIEISQIFSWFKGDFTKNGTLIEFLNQYSTVKINANASIRHLDYKWNLNE